MTRPQPVKIGPFTGGLNLASDPSMIADNELVVCKNMELDLDGSLITRPPIHELDTPPDGYDFRYYQKIIGKAILNGVSYLIMNNGNAIFAFDGTEYTIIRNLLDSDVAIQYQDLVFVVATEDSFNPGGYWDGVTWTTDNNMPRGSSAIFHKQRMFVVPGEEATGPEAHQLKFTDPISISAPTPLVWTPTNLIPVSQGDGENLIDIVVYNDNLLMFKQDSTWAFAFDSDPADGILREINNQIGSSGKNCVVQHENSLYNFHEGVVYEIVNYDFKPINLKVPFELDASRPAWADDYVQDIFIATLGNRLLVRYFGRLYCYNIRTKSWGTWESAIEGNNYIGRPVEFPNISSTFTNPKYYACSIMSIEDPATNPDQFETQRIFLIQDRLDGTTNERYLDLVEDEFVSSDIECVIKTKNFSAEETHRYKRLMWWGADVSTQRELTAIATPVTANYAVTWNDLHTYTWEDLHNNTWDQPLTNTLNFTTVVNNNLSAGRKFIKFLKALRWRQINFEIRMLTNGTTVDGPCRLFSLTAILGSKQTVVKQVS